MEGADVGGAGVANVGGASDLLALNFWVPRKVTDVEANDFDVLMMIMMI